MLTPTSRLFLTAVCLLAGWRPFVQAQTGTSRAFEVASIKPSAPDARATSSVMPPGGRLEIVNMTLKEMIAKAYGVQPFQVSGGPGWLDSIHYDISAKAGAQRMREDVPETAAPIRRCRDAVRRAGILLQGNPADLGGLRSRP